MGTKSPGKSKRGFTLLLVLASLALISPLILSFISESGVFSKKTRFYSTDIISGGNNSVYIDSLIGSVLNAHDKNSELLIPLSNGQASKYSYAFKKKENSKDFISLMEDASRELSEFKNLGEVDFDTLDPRQASITFIKPLPERKGLPLSVSRVKLTIQDQSYKINPHWMTPFPWSINQPTRSIYSQPLQLSSGTCTSLSRWIWPNAEQNSFNAEFFQDFQKGGFQLSSDKSRAFLSDSDMDAFFKNHGYSFGRDYFTTENYFSNKPSSVFQADPPIKIDSNKSISYDYQANQKKPWAAFLNNVNVIPSLVQNSMGNSVISHRFPLRRLDLFKDPEKNASLILTYFGLQQNSEGYWEYKHGYADNGSKKIYSITDPGFLALKRDPDFFELLQLGILSGSIGQFSDSMPYTDRLDIDKSNAMHLFQIGLNIIDQWDSDSYPTLGIWDSTKFAGIEDLPLINEFFLSPFRKSQAAGNSATQGNIYLWYLFELWNPHRKATTSAASSAPTKLRIVATGSQSVVAMWGSQFKSPVGIYPYPYVENWGAATTLKYSGAHWIEFPYSSDTFRDPQLLRPNSDSPMGNPVAGVTSSANGSIVDPNASYFAKTYTPYNAATTSVGPVNEIGIFGGSGGNAWKTATPPYPKNTYYGVMECAICTGATGGPIFELQFLDQKGVWKPYQHLGYTKGLSAGSLEYSMGMPNYSKPTYPVLHQMRNMGGFYKHDSTATNIALEAEHLSYQYFGLSKNGIGFIDPRSFRVGIGATILSPNSPMKPSAEINTGFGANYPVDSGTYFKNVEDQTGQGITIPRGGSICTSKTGETITLIGVNTKACYSYDAAYFAMNSPEDYPKKPYYLDRDGVSRKGDANKSEEAYFWQHSMPDSFSRYTGDSVYDNRTRQTRNVVLNRPFTSVAELGYVHRDLPFKSLDFLTYNSGDSMLLDLFSIDEESETTASRLNLEQAPQEILEALITNSKVNSEGDSLFSVGGLEPLAIAKSISERGKGIVDFPSLVQTLSTILDASPTTTKETRESIIRSLSDVAAFGHLNLKVDMECSEMTLNESKNMNGVTPRNIRKQSCAISVDLVHRKILHYSWSEK